VTSTAQDLQESIAWIEHQFPGWSVSVATTRTGRGDYKPIWIARAEGHHPQAALSAAKLHTRLSDYQAREDRRERFARPKRSRTR
jgi:hypothetical protein